VPNLGLVGLSQPQLASAFIRRVEVGIDLPSAPTTTLYGAPLSFRTLRITWQARSDNAAAPIFSLRFNDDSGSNYDFSGQVTSGTATYNSASQTSMRISVIPGTGTTAGFFAGGVTRIINAASVTMAKTVVTASQRPDLPAGEFSAGLWRNTTQPISSISFIAAAGNIINGSWFEIWGEP
jgi:hypothetical protein